MKKLLLSAAAVVMSVFCIGASVGAYEVHDDGGYADIHLMRTANENTYNICVTYTFFDTESFYADCISEALKEVGEYDRVRTDLQCMLTIDSGEMVKTVWLDGFADNYFYMSGTVMFETEITLPTGDSTVYADIWHADEWFDSECLFEGETDVHVYPGEFVDNGGDVLVNEGLGYELLRRINLYRTKIGGQELRTNCDITDLARDRLCTAVEMDNFSHDGLSGNYSDYGIRTEKKSEYFIVGSSSCDELMCFLIGDDSFADKVFEGDFRKIGIAALTEQDSNIGYWAIELYR